MSATCWDLFHHPVYDAPAVQQLFILMVLTGTAVFDIIAMVMVMLLAMFAVYVSQPRLES